MFQIGAMAVYPAHGVGVIESIQEREVAGFLQSFYIMRLLDTDMIIMIPTKNANNIGLRTVIDRQAVNEIFEILRERPTCLNQQTWNRRYRDYMDKIKTGSLFRVAEVLPGPDPAQAGEGALLRGAENAGYRKKSIGERALSG